MKSLMLLLAIGLASSDKLDRTYLPPPGSKFAGGSPEDNQVPFEFPKETYSTTLRPGLANDRLTPEDSRLTIGSDRGTGLPNIPTRLKGGASSRPQAPITIFQDPFKIPTTTTSYAFTQTTTFPSVGFETTVSPVDPFIDFKHQTTGLGYPQLPQDQQISEQIYPGYGSVTSGQHSKDLGPSTGGPGFESQPPFPAGPTFIDRSQGYSQTHPKDFTQYQQALHLSSTLSPTTVSTQPRLVPQSQTNYLGVQPPRQLIGHQSTFPEVHPTERIPQTYQPGIPQYSNSSQNILRTLTQGSNIPDQVGGSTHFGGPLGSIPSTISLQNLPSTYQPGTEYGTDIGNIQGNGPVSNIPQQYVGQPTIGLQGISPQGIPSSFQQGTSQYGTDVSNIQGGFTPGSTVPFQQLGPERPLQTFDQYGTLRATVSPQGLPSSNQPSSQYGTDPASFQVPNTSQTSVPGQQTQTVQMGRPHTTLQDSYPSTKPGLFDSSSQNIYQPDSTATSSVVPPGYFNQNTIPSTTPTIFPSYGTTAPDKTQSPTTPTYSGISSEGNIAPIRLEQRPERPRAESDRNSVILSYENIFTPDGYAYSFETSNGIHADESGIATDGVKAQGSYSYTGDDGKLYSVVYTADENGFQPRGDHLPTPPPVPEAIQRVIEQAAKDKEAGISHDGFYDEDKYGHEKYQGPKNRLYPKTQDKIIINGVDIPNNEETEIQATGHKKIGPQSGRRRPVSTNKQMPHKYDEDFSEYDQHLRVGQISEGQRKRPTNRVPLRRRPFNKFKNQNEHENTYDEEENIQKTLNQQSTKTKNNKYIEYDDNLQVSPGDTTIKEHAGTERLQGSKRPKYTGIKFIKDFDDRKTQDLDKDNHLMIPSGSHTSSSSTAYVESEDYSEGRQQKLGAPGITKKITRLRPKGSKRPQSLSTSLSGIKSDKLRLPGTSVPLSYDDIPNVNYDEKNQRPTVDHTTDTDNINQSQEPSNEESGYQYIVPRTKFIQNETNEFPSRFTKVAEITSTKRTFETSDRTTTIQPFMTPNIAREDDIDDESDDDIVNQRFPSRKPSKSSVTTMSINTQNEYDDDFESDDGSDYNESNTEPNEEDNIPVRMQSGKPETTRVSSTRHPIYDGSRQTTTRPKYDEEYSPNKQGRIGQKPIRPGQMRNKQYLEESTEEDTYSDQNTKIPKTTGYSLVLSTTPTPAQASMRPSGSDLQTTQPQHPTTYDASRTMSDYFDQKMAPRVSVTRPTIRPSYLDGTTIPEFSTTRPGTSQAPSYRPTSKSTTEYPDRTKVQEPVTIRSGFPKIPTSEPITEYDKTVLPGSVSVRPGTFRIPSTTIRPSTIADYERTISPGFTTTKTGSRLTGRPGIQSQNIPSTTYRPNYTLADLTTQTVDQSLPGIAVDRYGIPISRPGSGVTGGTTYLPEYSTTSTQNVGIPPVRNYQDFQTTGKESQTFKLNEPRFGKFEYGTSQGTGPDTFDSTSHQGPIPSYPGDYTAQTSTERIIGEDFSGPKQPQRFDPETGYHY